MIRLWLRYLIIGIMLLMIGIFWYFKLYHYLSFHALYDYRQQLLVLTQQHYTLMVLGFISTYIIVVALSVPGAVFLTLASGFMFGIIAGTVYVVIGATLGATLLFLAVRTVLGTWLAKHLSGWMVKFELGLYEDAFCYVLMLRLIPIFPFWLINFVPALLNVPLRAFVLATALGIIPDSLVYVMVGHGLDAMFKQGRAPDLDIMFTPAIFVPMLALAALSLLPVFYKHMKGKH